MSPSPEHQASSLGLAFFQEAASGACGHSCECLKWVAFVGMDEVTI